MQNDGDAVFGGAAKLFSLVEMIYGAVEDVSLWNGVMERISEAVHGEWTVMWPSFSHPAAPDITASARVDPVALRSYAEHFASVNVISQGIEKVYPDALMSYSHEVISDEDFERSEYYNDYFKPNGLYYAFGMKVHVGMEAPAFVSNVRPKASGPFGQNETPVFTTLLPHLQRALKLHLQFSQLRSHAGGLESALNAFDVAVFGLNGAGRVAFANRAAQQIVQAGDGMSLCQGRLTAGDFAQNAKLQALLAGAIETGCGGGIGSGGVLLLSRRYEKPPLRVTVTPFSPGLMRNYGQLAAQVFVADGQRKPQSRSAALQTLYRLSPTESRLTDLLAAGYDIADAAELLRMSVATARFHLKTIFQKTETNRQTDLLRLVLGLPGSL